MLAGAVAHAGIAGIEALVSGVVTDGLDPFLRLLPGGIAAFLTVAGSQGSMPRLAGRGVIAGGLASLLGISLSLLLGQPGPQVLPPLVSVTGNGVVVGLAIGGLIGLGGRRSRSESKVPQEHPAESYPEAP